MSAKILPMAILALACLSACREKRPEASSAAIQALSQPAPAGFARADKPRSFSFPADDGPHPDFQTEWWYFTGNLATAAGRPFGYELTIFRRGMAPGDDAPDDWATHQLYFAHFTISDIQSGRFHPFERFGRASIGLAGAQAKPFKVWIDNWSLSGDPNRVMRLSAADGEVKLDLTLNALKPPVLQGDKGLSRKSKGNASYYYSRSRIRSQGQLKIGANTHQLTGLSWMDREWSTSALSQDQSGWDWFSLQLDDQRELMLYQLRLKNGGIDSFSSGTLIEKDGSSRHLSLSDFHIEVLGNWQSPQTGISYPSGWRVTVPKANLNLTIQPKMPNQELPGDLRYWEGAVEIGGPVKGDGYVELTGYQ